MEILKRLINLVVCWMIVGVLPMFMFSAVVLIGVYKVFCNEWPKGEGEKIFKVMALGEQGIFDLR